MNSPVGTGLVDRVYREILGSIIDGEFKEGDKLPTELALTGRFTASRPTIREALSRLRADGITSTRQGSGTFVKRRPDQIKRPCHQAACFSSKQIDNRLAYIR